MKKKIVYTDEPMGAVEVVADFFKSTEEGARAEHQTIASTVQTMGLRFTGFGSEYFRIWIVNLLLTLVTLTMYWPFARARRMAYFHKNTLVGSDALAFHADPWKMFRGYLLVLLMLLVLGGVYFGASTFMSELAWLPLLPMLVLAVLWPALWHSSLMFRLRHTSWRGVQFEFKGSLLGAYGVLLPLFVPPILMVVGGASAETADLVLTTVVFLLMFPWLIARIQTFKYSGYVFTAQRTTLAEGKITGALYVIGLQMIGGVLILSLVAYGMFLFILLVGAVMDVLGAMGGAKGLSPMMTSGAGLICLALPLVLLPYFKTRLQNLLWGNTRSDHVLIHSKLRFRDMFKVNLVNWVLIVVTLGFYWPFAAVRLARVRLEAMAVEVHGDVNTWVADDAAVFLKDRPNPGIDHRICGMKQTSLGATGDERNASKTSH